MIFLLSLQLNNLFGPDKKLSSICYKDFWNVQYNLTFAQTYYYAHKKSGLENERHIIICLVYPVSMCHAGIVVSSSNYRSEGRRIEPR